MSVTLAACAINKILRPVTRGETIIAVKMKGLFCKSIEKLAKNREFFVFGNITTNFAFISVDKCRIFVYNHYDF